MEATESAKVNQVQLIPVPCHPRKRVFGLADGTELYRLAFRIMPSFLNGFIELRFPEVLQSSMGFHFLDHYRTTLAPLSEPEPFPQWQCSPDRAQLAYAHTTHEGLEFGGHAVAVRDGVNLSFHVQNHGKEDLRDVEPNMCLEFSGCADFKPNQLDSIYICAGGKLKILSDVTPSPIKNGQIWPLILTRKGVGRFQVPQDSPSWTLIDTVADENLMAIKSADGRWLVGYAWDAMPLTQMSNCRYPCLHTGPGACEMLKSGDEHRWFGKIYFCRGDEESTLLQKYRADQTKLFSENIE